MGWRRGQGSFEGQRSAFELFGYDFMIDEGLKVWLIEANCSPSLEHSTPVTAALVPQLIHDLFLVSHPFCRLANERHSLSMVPLFPLFSFDAYIPFSLFIFGGGGMYLQGQLEGMSIFLFPFFGGWGGGDRDREGGRRGGEVGR